MPDVTKVFISYAREDIETAGRLYDDLEAAGLSPWMAKENLMIGENWEFKIRQEIKDCAYFIALISEHSISKRGYVRKELKLALDILDQIPPSDIFVLPVRLDESAPEHERLKKRHWGELFPSYDDGLKQILRVLVPDRPLTEHGRISKVPEVKQIRDSVDQIESGEEPKAEPVHSENPTTKT